MILKRTYLFLIFVILGFNSEVKTMLSNMPLNRRPSMLEGGRGGQQEVRGDQLGKRCIKTISKMTHLSFIFVFGTTQPSPIAFPMLPCIGKAHPRVVSRLRQSKHRQSIVSIVATSPSRDRAIVTAAVCAPDRRRHATGDAATSTITL